ncbi:hypothetical protein [Acidovorax sp. sic0104]|uniref:hypothetical protein n=1 Tax=Acidovorax sp. sic0104 TaxID=2854784 RepID=UPI001C45FF02|nr:hypothetical protein [Acidovorax sp. sic0104]MBV7542165.1 hypothetical protein [Acidovorax sp. sic0104]
MQTIEKTVPSAPASAASGLAYPESESRDPAGPPPKAHGSVGERIKCWYGVSCSLVTDEPVPGIDLKPLAPNSAIFVGARYRVGDNLNERTARVLATALGLDWQEGPKPRPVFTEAESRQASTDLWKGLGVRSA